jgi:biotin transport system substrate-specific component
MMVRNVHQKRGNPNASILPFGPQLRIFSSIEYWRMSSMAEVNQVSLSRYVALKSDHALAQAFWITTFALLTAVGAQIEIPHQPVPFTLQTFFVLLAGGVLGWRNGMLSMSLYVAMGAVGMPVFAGGGFGLARLLGPTGGYLLSFPVAACFVGALVSFRPQSVPKNIGRVRPFVEEYGRILFAMIGGLMVIFLIGTLQLNAVFFHNWKSAFESGFLLFSWWDLLKLGAAVAVCRELRR